MNPIAGIFIIMSIIVANVQMWITFQTNSELKEMAIKAKCAEHSKDSGQFEWVIKEK